MLQLSTLIFPLMLAVSAGFFLYFAGSAFHARRFVALGLSTALCVLLIAIFPRLTSDDPRHPSAMPVLVVGAILGYAGFRRVLRNPPHSDIAAFIGIVTVFLAFGALVQGPFTMHPLENHALVSPDGKYTARLVYWDGMTFGYYFVCIKSNSKLDSWRGADEVAEADSEGIEGLRWKDSRTLSIQYGDRSGLVQSDKHWRDVSIKYDVQASPEESGK